MAGESALSPAGRRVCGRLLAAAAIGRLPLGMTPLALILLVRDRQGSYTVAGLAVAAHSAGITIGQPFGARVVSRGPWRLLGLALAYCVALGVIGTSAYSDGGPMLLLVASLTAGMLLPPIGAAARAAWPVVTKSTSVLERAYAMEGTLQELPGLAGPPAVASVADLGSPQVAIGASGCIGLVGASLLSPLLARVAPPRGWDGGSPGNALRPTGIRTVLLVALVFACGAGGVEVAMPAFAEAHGNRAAAGLLLAGYAAGAIIGGLAQRARPPGQNLNSRYVVAYGLAAVAATALLPPWNVPTMTGAAILAGIPTSRLFALAYVQINRQAVQHARAETFGWFSSAVTMGTAGGNLLVGYCITRFGVSAGLAVIVLSASVAAAIAVLRRATLA
jgi:predicted MFS family arabinose efflux permease